MSGRMFLVGAISVLVGSAMAADETVATGQASRPEGALYLLTDEQNGDVMRITPAGAMD